MKRQKYLALMVVAGLAANLSFAGKKASSPAGVAAESIAAAEAAVSDARMALENAKTAVGSISGNSALMAEVKVMLQASAENWNLAIAALEQSKKNAERISTSKDGQMANDYARLAKVNAGIAISGASVVSVGLDFVKAAADNKTESLDVIRGAMKDAQGFAEEVRVSSERTIGLIEAKYSK